MNCRECQELLVARDEGLLEPGRRDELVEHLSGCPACREAGDAAGQLRRRLERRGQVCRQAGADQIVMDRIMREQSIQLRRLAMQKRIRFASMVAAVAATVTVAFALSGLFRQKEATAAEVLAQAVSAASELQAVHLKGRMRTPPQDNFEAIDLETDFVPIELWKTFLPTVQWRLEKPGRIVVMNGRETLLWIKTSNEAAKGPPSVPGESGVAPSLRPLMNVESLLESELKQATEGMTDLAMTHEKAGAGAEKLVVTVKTKAQGDLTNDWLRNKDLYSSDTRRVYTFDAASKRLEGVKVYVQTKDADVLVLEISEVEYNPSLDPAIFSLDLPKDVTWLGQPQVLSDNDKYQKMTPEEVARAFFEACGKGDWDEAAKLDASATISKVLKEYLIGCQVVSIGKSFKSGLYPGVFVPYEIKLKDGHTKKMNLAVRNDNDAKRYVVDGGI
jgi:outer membrane lipoprotein-sorting protein